MTGTFDARLEALVRAYPTMSQAQLGLRLGVHHTIVSVALARIRRKDTLRAEVMRLAAKNPPPDGRGVMMGEFEEWTVQRQWWVALVEVDQHGFFQGETPLSIWPTRDAAIADRPNHGHEHKYVSGRWVPNNPPHDYQQIEVVCRDVRKTLRARDYPLASAQTIALDDDAGPTSINPTSRP